MAGHSSTWKASFVAVRILGLYLVAHGLILAATSASILVEPAPGTLRWSLVFAIVLLLAAGVELWLGADTIAARIARVANEQEFEEVDELEDDDEDDSDEVEEVTGTRSPTAMGARTMLSIGLTILGVFILIDAISAIIVEVGNLIQARSVTSTTGFFVPQARLGPYYFALAALALRAALGAWLAFGSQATGRFFHRIRYWPAEPPEPDQ